MKKIIKLQSVNFCHNKSRKIANSWWNKYFIALVWYMWAHVSDLFGHLQYTKCKYVQCTIKNIIWIYLLCWPTGIPYIPGWRIRKQFFLIKPTDPSKKDVRNILTWVIIIKYLSNKTVSSFLISIKNYCPVSPSWMNFMILKHKNNVVKQKRMKCNKIIIFMNKKTVNNTVIS